MSSALMIPGVLFDFGGGRKYLIPPLSLGSLEVLQERLNKLPELTATDGATAAVILDAAFAALLRNYPDITRVQVGDLVDLGNMFQVHQAVMDISGALRKATDEGNRLAMSQLTGEGSSPLSAPTPAGPGAT